VGHFAKECGQGEATKVAALQEVEEESWVNRALEESKECFGKLDKQKDTDPFPLLPQITI
jgi:hypothetical protein